MDFFCGSGTLGESAAQHRRGFVLIDKLTPYKLWEQIVEHKNTASGILFRVKFEGYAEPEWQEYYNLRKTTAMLSYLAANPSAQARVDELKKKKKKRGKK